MSLTDESYVAPLRARIAGMVQDQIPVDAWSAVADRKPIMVSDDHSQVHIPLVDGTFMVLTMTIESIGPRTRSIHEHAGGH